MKIISRKEFITTKWSGGETTQMFLWPVTGEYQNRNFEVRVSSATVELEKTVFTRLQGVSRYITTLTGTLKLRINQKEEIQVKPYEILKFAGEDCVESQGIAKDFNLMMKGRRGEMLALLEEDNRVTFSDGILIFYSENSEMGICHRGANGKYENWTIPVGDLGVMLVKRESYSRIHLKPGGQGICCKVWDN